jgi:parallel beta-helix repeat protein
MVGAPWKRVARAGVVTSLLFGVLNVVGFVLSTTRADAQPLPPSGAIIVNNGSYANQSQLPSACAAPAFTSIQSAIADAASGSTIYVCAGTYSQNLSIDEPLTLDGAEFGADAVGRSGEPETMIDGPGGISFGGGATTGTVDGFSLTGYSGNAGEIQATGVGSAWTFDDNIMDVSDGGIDFNTDSLSNPGPTNIADNQFTQSIGSTAPTGNQGQAVRIVGEPADDVTIEGNDFSELSGPGGSINTAGAGTGTACPSSSHGLVISSNTSEVNGQDEDQALVSLLCTTAASITHNVYRVTDSNDTAAVGPVLLAGGDDSTTVSSNTLLGDGATHPGGAITVTDTSGGNQSTTIEGNTVEGWGDDQAADGQGVQVTEGSGDFTIEDNTLTSDGYGIWISGSSGNAPPGTISGNDVHGSLVTDCQDDSTGSGTQSTNDTWSDNIGTTSSPSGLCGMAASTTSGTPSVSSFTVGGSLTETASVSGITAGPPPTGNVVFTACGPTSAASCSNYDSTVGTSPLAPSAGDLSSAVSPRFQPTAAGNWCFEADYVQGDSNYLPSLDDTTSGCFTVRYLTSSTPYVDDLPTAGVYNVPSAFLNVQTTGDGIQSIKSSTPKVCLVFNYVAYFVGTGRCTLTASVATGSDYSAARGRPQSFSVVRAPTTTEANTSTKTITLGHSVTDVAVVKDDASVDPPPGAVTFYVCGPTSKPARCTSTHRQVGKPNTLHAIASATSRTTSAGFIPTAVGYWCFASSYSGTADFIPSADSSIPRQCVKVTGRR